MISKIHIQNTATIKDAEIEPLQINYFFGGNGSGKTSISRFLDDSENYNNGTIVKDSASEVLVYNRDFIDKNFGQFIVISVHRKVMLSMDFLFYFALSAYRLTP